MTGSNDAYPTRLERLLSELRIRIISDEGVVPYRFEVNGLEMSEGYFRWFLAEKQLGVTVEQVVRALRKGR